MKLHMHIIVYFKHFGIYLVSINHLTSYIMHDDIKILSDGTMCTYSTLSTSMNNNVMYFVCLDFLLKYL